MHVLSNTYNNAYFCIARMSALPTLANQYELLVIQKQPSMAGKDTPKAPTLKVVVGGAAVVVEVVVATRKSLTATREVCRIAV